MHMLYDFFRFYFFLVYRDGVIMKTFPCHVTNSNTIWTKIMNGDSVCIKQKNDKKHRINTEKWSFVCLEKNKIAKRSKNIAHTSNKDNLIGLKEFFKCDCDDCSCVIID